MIIDKALTPGGGVVDYDILAPDYKDYRLADARIEAGIHKHLRPGLRVLNVGAGQGSYEPRDCDVIAVEPSSGMIARRLPDKAPVVQASAENLPFDDDSFDVALALLTIHHWPDILKGLSELKRVTREKIILMTWNGDFGEFWLDDYLPEIATIDVDLFPKIDWLTSVLGAKTQVDVLDIPHDCTDGFMCAYWRRPEMYLHAPARQAISTFARMGDTTAGLSALRRDLASGAWHRKYSHLLHRDVLDCGYRLIVCDNGSNNASG